MRKSTKHYTFWMVYVDGQQGSTHKHGTKALAEAEATRLARLSPGKAVFVLKAIAIVQADDQPVTWTRPTPYLDREDDYVF